VYHRTKLQDHCSCTSLKRNRSTKRYKSEPDRTTDLNMNTMHRYLGYFLKSEGWRQVTERRGQVVITPASYSEGSRFKLGLQTGYPE
jgi:hypothetical protein